ncbi:MAG: hypothetical protein JWL92_533 [Candidatus Nomurabacteria bacterium]|nr:hypothetical protein [Candidatus Nomurabacteria bacterium]
MFSLQKNSNTLKEHFGEFLTAVSAGKKPGQKILGNCLAECHATNEIAGVKFLSLRHYSTCLISPVFIDGIDHFQALDTTVGPEYAKLLQTTGEQKGQLDFNARKHWNNDHFIFLDSLSLMNDPKKMLDEGVYVALSVLKQSENPIGMVCGPVSTGPGTIMDNLYRFNRTMMEVSKEIYVFNQLPFEGVFQKVHDLLTTTHKYLLEIEDVDSEEEMKRKKSMFFMEHFFERVIKEAHKDWRPYFMKGWKKSVGATTEHELFKLLGFNPIYLENEFSFLN